MNRKKFAVLLIIIGVLLMLISPNIVDEWNDHVNYKTDATYLYDSIIRGFAVVLLGFASLLTGTIIMVLNHFNKSQQ